MVVPAQASPAAGRQAGRHDDEVRRRGGAQRREGLGGEGVALEVAHRELGGAVIRGPELARRAHEHAHPRLPPLAAGRLRVEVAYAAHVAVLDGRALVGGRGVGEQRVVLLRRRRVRVQARPRVRDHVAEAHEGLLRQRLGGDLEVDVPDLKRERHIVIVVVVVVVCCFCCCIVLCEYLLPLFSSSSCSPLSSDFSSTSFSCCSSSFFFSPAFAELGLTRGLAGKGSLGILRCRGDFLLEAIRKDSAAPGPSCTLRQGWKMGVGQQLRRSYH